MLIRDRGFYTPFLLLMIIATPCVPVLAQGMNYMTPYQNANNYPTTNLTANSPTSYPNSNNAPSGNMQYYQNPNYPLQGNMQLAPYQNSPQNQNYRIQRNAPPFQNSDYGEQNNGQFYQNPNYPEQNNNSQPYQNYPSTDFNQSYPNPSQNSGYAQPGNVQPFQNPNYPTQGAAPPYQSYGYTAPSNVTPAQHREASELTNRAYAFSQAGNNEEAINLLQQSLAIDPSSRVAHLDMTVALIALKRYDEALHESTIVLQMNPDDEKGYLNYLAAAIGANQMQDALRVGQEYLSRFPNGQNRTKLANEMFAVEHELDRRANARGIMPPPGSPDNYLFFVTPRGKLRWMPQDLPLKVYIKDGRGRKGFSPECNNILINSFMTWQNSSRGLMRFVPVDNPHQANIDCRWTDSANDITLAAEAGDAKLEAAQGTIFHVTITLLTCRPESKSEQLALPLLRQVCLHEIGHSLGLDGHSDRAQDIMYCSTNPNVEHPELTQRDVNTLMLLYQ